MDFPKTLSYPLTQIFARLENISRSKQFSIKNCRRSILWHKFSANINSNTAFFESARRTETFFRAPARIHQTTKTHKAPGFSILCRLPLHERWKQRNWIFMPFPPARRDKVNNAFILKFSVDVNIHFPSLDSSRQRREVYDVLFEFIRSQSLMVPFELSSA